MRRRFRFRGMDALASSLVSILAGLAFGLILLYVFNPARAWNGFLNILLTGVRSTQRLGKVFYTAAPLLMTGLAVGFAFKTGLFNIGATGQFTMGAFMALTGAIAWQLPWYLCLPLAIVAGALWGAIPGLCKALFNVHEVISSIMFNWIGLFTVNLLLNNMPVMLANYWGDVTHERTAALARANPAAILPKLGMDVAMRYPGMNIAIFIAALAALVMWFILQKTTFGYELKACGYNRSASLYAGINAKRSIVLSMVIAGALAGLGGGLYYLSGTVQFTLGKELSAMGFNGIPVALLAASHPLGTVLSALFVSHIQVGGDAMQPEFAREMIDIIIASIIYLSAFALLMRELITGARRRRAMRLEDAAAPPAAQGMGGEPL
ncbi:MAG TPA: ABC transporter permease [Candidatus Limnocylindria bacterium]|nr:ABC transporter permease [Candidatus Limnocylindria bacterium]